MAGIGDALSVFGLGVQVFGGAQENKDIRRATELRANQATENARLTREKTVELERRLRINNVKDLGSIRAAAGASGVRGGSAFDILAESAANAELNALTLRHAGELTAIGFERDVEIIRAGGEAQQTAVDIKTLSGALSTGGAILRRTA